MHELELINETIDIYDEIDFSTSDDNKITIISSDDIPLDERNSIYKAAQLFKTTYDIKDGFIFKVKKRIPIEAGLGGESTDAAGTLLLLNEYYKLNIDKDELSKLGIKIGSDVPFFIHSGFKRVSNIGDIITDLDICNKYNNYIIVKPNFGLSTKEMFKKIDDTNFTRVDYSKMPYNDFMKVVPQSILDIKDYFNKLGLSNHTLSGSGSSYYVALYNKDSKLYNKIKNHYKEYMVMEASNCDGFIITRGD